MFVSSASRLGFRLVAFALIGTVAGLLSYLRAEANPSDTQPRIVGEARVVDGDTIVVAGLHIRLEGIDAPESGQTCSLSAEAAAQPAVAVVDEPDTADMARHGLHAAVEPESTPAWHCGAAASAVLERMLRGRQVSCDPTGRDKYGRTLATCFTEGHDVNAEMVRRGWAWAFVRYSRRYVGLEAEARAERLGIWRGHATPPWEFRRQQWAGAESEAPGGCAIKANSGRNGLIYHMPWSPWYGKLRMDVRDGHRRWFCSEAEALAAGYRPARAF